MVSDMASAKRFYDAIMTGTDEGRPGLRDPDGNRVEAVCDLVA